MAVSRPAAEALIMERIWLKSYLPGMAADIDPDTLRSLKQMAEQSFGKFPERSAYIQMGRHLTYRQLDRMSRDFAAWLQNVAGLQPGDHAAERPAVPDRHVRGLAGRNDGRQHQSALHRT
jgi:non-ribosomal peptide synthetase component F